MTKIHAIFYSSSMMIRSKVVVVVVVVLYCNCYPCFLDRELASRYNSLPYTKRGYLDTVVLRRLRSFIPQGDMNMNCTLRTTKQAAERAAERIGADDGQCSAEESESLIKTRLPSVHGSLVASAWISPWI